MTDKALEETSSVRRMASSRALRRTHVRNGSRCCQAWCRCCWRLSLRDWPARMARPA